MSQFIITLAPLPAWRDPGITVLGLALRGVAVALILFVVRKPIVLHARDSGGRAAPLYLIPGSYGGAFVIMLIAWPLL